MSRALLALAAAAQERGIRVISGVAPGGAGKPMARLVAECVPPQMGARGVVENRTGANGLTPDFEDTRSFNARIASDLRPWGQVIRAAGARDV